MIALKILTLHNVLDFKIRCCNASNVALRNMKHYASEYFNKG